MLHGIVSRRLNRMLGRRIRTKGRASGEVRDQEQWSRVLDLLGKLEVIASGTEPASQGGAGNDAQIPIT